MNWACAVSFAAFLVTHQLVSRLLAPVSLQLGTLLSFYHLALDFSLLVFAASWRYDDRAHAKVFFATA